MASIRKVLPLLNRIIVRRLEAPTQSAGGILLPETKASDLKVATVLSVGPGIHDNGVFRETLVGVGQKVLLPSYGGQEIDIDDEKVHIFRDTEIVGIVE